MEAIDLYLDAYGDSMLHLIGWMRGSGTLGKINDMLSVFKQATKSLECPVGSLTKGLPAMDFILTKFEDGRAQYRTTQSWPRFTRLVGRK
jgi:hypothetical protein